MSPENVVPIMLNMEREISTLEMDIVMKKVTKEVKKLVAISFGKLIQALFHFPSIRRTVS